MSAQPPQADGGPPADARAGGAEVAPHPDGPPARDGRPDVATGDPPASLVCIACGARYPVADPRVDCRCGGLLEVEQVLAVARGAEFGRRFAERWGVRGGIDGSGVWRYRELIAGGALPDGSLVTLAEGNTPLYESSRVAAWAGLPALRLKHEGLNPTGSFKDRGMAVGVSRARAVGARLVACASTGNTSASMAAYAAIAELTGIVFIPAGKISTGKLAQAIAYGSRIVQIRGDFDAAMRLVRQVAHRYGVYLLNSVNPWRLEGQKTITLEVLQQLGWRAPDWIVLPGGNLGNTAALGNALEAALALGLIDRLPRVAVVQAAGAAPFYRAFADGWARFEPTTPQTVASAINIGNPVSYPRARHVVERTGGVVEQVSDTEIMAAKAVVDGAGIGCEPASAAAVAGARKLREVGVIAPGATVVSILTGHVLKDTDAVLSNFGAGVEVVEPTLEGVAGLLERLG